MKAVFRTLLICSVLLAAPIMGFAVEIKKTKSKVEQNSCKIFPVNVNEKIKNRLERNYRISQLADKSYQADLKIKFAGTDMTQKVNECLAKHDSRLKGPHGESLKIRVNEFSKSGTPPSEIKIKIENSNRINLHNWSATRDCNGIVKDVLQLIGLVDEYPEHSTGYTVDHDSLQKGTIAKPAEDSGHYGCRIPGLPSSIMTSEAKDEDSKLMAAQFNFIVFPRCHSLNLTYNNCAKYSYRDAQDEKSMSCPLDEKDKNIYALCMQSRGQWLNQSLNFTNTNASSENTDSNTGTGENDEN